MGKIHEMQYKFNTKVTFRLLECHGYDLNLFKKKNLQESIHRTKRKEGKGKGNRGDVTILFTEFKENIYCFPWDPGLYAFCEVLERMETQ